MPRGFYVRNPVKKTQRRQCVDHEFQQHPKHKFDCYICTRRYYNERARLDRIKLWKEIAEYKLSKGCAKCGYSEHSAALEFDHIVPVAKPKQRKSIKVAIDFKRLIADSNVQVLCANCHRIKTIENGDNKPRNN